MMHCLFLSSNFKLLKSLSIGSSCVFEIDRFDRVFKRLLSMQHLDLVF